MAISVGEQEKLEMAGYSWGRRGSICYRNKDWTAEQAAAFRKGWESGNEYYNKSVGW